MQVHQSGRSMIEMLGVLAIIGVLSVGGIAGYSKAMHRYRVNKTIDQITYMAGAIRSFFAPQKSYNGLSVNCTDTQRANGQCMAKKAQLVPDEMWVEGEDDPQHEWGNGVVISSTCRTQAECDIGIYKAFDIIFLNIPEEACIDLLTQDWSNAGVGTIVVTNAKNAEDALRSPLFVIPPVSVDKAIRLCGCAADDPDGADEINFFFDVDVNDSYWKDQIDATTALLNGD
jgi:type II secretory pathway pseudopilin PulG